MILILVSRISTLMLFPATFYLYRSDLEEKNTTMLELRTRVEELKMENEYQLRLKDMNYNETIKQLTEKFVQEIELLKTKNQILKTDREKEVEKQQEEVCKLMKCGIYIHNFCHVY